MAERDSPVHEVESSETRLLEAAGRIFAAKGYAAATVREICEAASANVAAVNYHFGDKEQLYRAAVKSSHGLITRIVPLPSWPSGISPRRKLREFIRMMMRRVLLKGDPRFPWQHHLLLREMMDPTVACGEIVADYIRPQFEALCGILREMLPANLGPEELTRTAFSIVGQCLFYGLTQPVSRQLAPADLFSPEALAEHIFEFTLRGLAGLRDRLRAEAKVNRARRATIRRNKP